MSEQEFNSDVQTEASSEPQSQAPEVKSQDAASENVSGEGQSAQTETTNTPFHEHPRFKELVEQKNRYAEQAKQLEQRYSQLEKRLKGMEDSKSPTQQEKDALIERLKGIDPEFGSRFENLNGSLKEVAELKERLTQMDQRAFMQDAVTAVKSLHDQNKISPELQPRYNRELDIAYRSGQIKSVEDVQNVYKMVHEEYSKFLDGVRRAERESYVSGKKQDASKPTPQSKGEPVKSGKAEFSKDPAQARAELISRVLKQSKAGQDI